MLVLSRKLGEKIVIGENITLIIIEIGRGKARIGIEAPRDMPIWRKEVLDAENGRPLPGEAAGPVE
jgi:carbon storage regulator